IRLESPWQRTRSRLRFSRRWTVHADDTLLLKSVTAADAGIYQCCSSVWHRLCVTLALNVIDRPASECTPPMQVRMVGEPARLYLQLEGSGVDQIRWLYNSKPIEPRPGLLFVAMAQTYSSYPLSPQLWTSVGPTPTKAVVFHSDGFAVLDFEDCALKRPVAARLCGCHGGVGDKMDNEDQQLDGECDWVGDSGGHLLAAAGRLLFAALPLQQRLLAIESPAASSTKAWFSPRLLELGCRPRLLSYRRPQSDTLWTACDAAKRRRVAAAVADAEIWRVGSAGIRVLRLPDSSGEPAGDAGRSFGFVRRRIRLMVALACQTLTAAAEAKSTSERGYCCPTLSIEQTLFLHPQADTLLLHSSKNFSADAFDCCGSHNRKTNSVFSLDFFSSNPTGRLVVSERADRVLHLTADTMYLYRGQLALRMHSSLDACLCIRISNRTRAAPSGCWPSPTCRMRTGLMAVSPGKATVRLNF
uniref:Ig-like domain-containing protein n=1 Tax=Macrostomum lignano TaxID=282301 RepID=A0A1I8FN11_9PLAT